MSKARGLSYWEQLNDPRWAAKRDAVIANSNGECDHCGSKMNLQAHHLFYESGRDLWDYDDIELQALCKDCHLRAELGRRELIKTLIRVLPMTTTERVIGYLKGLEAETFAGHFGYDIRDHEEAVGFADVLHASAEELIEGVRLPVHEQTTLYTSLSVRRDGRERTLREAVSARTRRT
jgi:hypothetical protein